jgi:hypothetical protein
MVESVLAGIEVKSSLDKAELEDIFGKSSTLRAMRNTSGLTQNHPFITAFAYDCANINLSFFDFAASFFNSPDYSPSMICILNKSLFGLADTRGGKIIPVDEPIPNSIPVLYQSGEDTLLVYIYFLSRWITADTGQAELFRQYSDNLFSRMTSFNFDIDFLKMLAKDMKSRLIARDCFLRKASVPIEELYTIARKALGL